MQASDESRIAEAISRLDDNAKRLYEEALAEGYQNTVCPAENCGTVFLAHHHFVNCGRVNTCPMISRDDGEPKTLFQVMFPNAT